MFSSSARRRRDGALNVGEQFFVIPRLLDEIGGASLNSKNGIFHRAVGGDHDDGKVAIAFADVAQDLKPILVRQGEIKQHEVERAFRDAVQAFFPCSRALHRVVLHFEQSLERLADGRLIVNDEDRAGHGFRLGAAGKNSSFRHSQPF